MSQLNGDVAGVVTVLLSTTGADVVVVVDATTGPNMNSCLPARLGFPLLTKLTLTTSDDTGVLVLTTIFLFCLVCGELLFCSNLLLAISGNIAGSSLCCAASCDTNVRSWAGREIDDPTQIKLINTNLHQNW